MNNGRLRSNMTLLVVQVMTKLIASYDRRISFNDRRHFMTEPTVKLAGKF
jgi:hypothetical protein